MLMKKKLAALARLAILAILATFANSCVDVTEHDDTPQGNFEALWRIIDEHYCFFDYKPTTSSSKSSPTCSPN